MIDYSARRWARGLGIADMWSWPTRHCIAQALDVMLTISLLCIDLPAVKRSLTRGVPCV